MPDLRTLIPDPQRLRERLTEISRERLVIRQLLRLAARAERLSTHARSEEDSRRED